MKNYSAIREEYINGAGTIAVLAEKHGIPVGSLRRVAAAEGWAKRRKESADREKSTAVYLEQQMKRTEVMLNAVVDAAKNEHITESRLPELTHAFISLLEQQRAILGLSKAGSGCEKAAEETNNESDI